MEGLRPSGLMPVSKAAIDATDTVNDAVDRQRYGTALTCALLYLIVIEFVVKHMWEQEHGKTADYHHNVQSLFSDLPAFFGLVIAGEQRECERNLVGN